MNTIKKITLTPLDKFFFGGENFFNTEDGVFYFQASRDFPQQTTLLGLIRHQILLQNNLMKGGKIDPSKSADTWIGAQSFDASNTSPNFGKIIRLSPAFISKAGVRLQAYWRAKIEVEAPDSTEEKKKYKIIEQDFSFSELSFKASFYGKAEQDIILIENYTEKQGIEYGYKNTVTGKQLTYKDVYDTNEEAQIGIDKQSRIKKNSSGTVISDDDAKGFYKFKYCRLKPDFAFSFYVELDNSVTLEDALITMGKERSGFNMKVENVNDNTLQNAQIQAGSKIVLLSDALVKNEIYDHCDTIISDTISFKNIKNTVSGTTNHAGKPTWSNRLNLLKRGSILQISKSANVEHVKTLLNQANFQNIGYNYYTNY